MRPCDTMAKCHLPCVFCRSFKILIISASEFGTVSMCRQMRGCTDEFLATVSERVVHGVYQVVTRSSFSVTQQQKVSGGFGHFTTRNKVQGFVIYNPRYRGL